MEGISLLIEVTGITVAGLLMILLGKWDQRTEVPPWLKFVAQISIVSLVVFAGIKIDFIRSASGGYWYLAQLSIPLTIGWLISVTNSVGQTDELGDITPFVVLVASLTFLVVTLIQKQELILAQLLSLFLAIFSLLIIYLTKVKKRKKSQYFSAYYMFFGFMLGIIAIVGVVKSTAALTLLIPLLVLGYPIADTSFYFIASYFHDDYLNSPNESKLRQKLIGQGFSWEGANMVIIMASIYLSFIAIVISMWPDIYLFSFLAGMGCMVFLGLKKLVTSEGDIIIWDKKRNKIELFGIPLDRIDNEQALEKINQLIENRKPSYLITPDTLAMLKARKDKQYFQITREADLVTPDGAGILWATSMLKKPLIERITGIDLINKICQLAIDKNYRIYLLGAKPGVVSKAKENIEKRYPEIQIVGYHHGYLQDNSTKKMNSNDRSVSSERAIIRDIRNKKPDLLLVGMGVPKQEKWITKNLHELNVPLSIGVGGSFDVLSGRIPRAPLWMQNHGMEWLYRLMIEPKRIKRTIALPYFMWLVLLGKIETFFRHKHT